MILLTAKVIESVASAYRFLAYLPNIKLFENAKQLAAFIGVSPKQKGSGKYIGQTRLSKLGNSRLRNILYLSLFSPVEKVYTTALVLGLILACFMNK